MSRNITSITPHARAALDTIANAEGTWDSTNNRVRYNVSLGYGTFDNNQPHPDQVRSAGRWKSTAHGGYQFLTPTWKSANGGRNAPMTAANQDLAALELIRRRGVNPDAPLDRNALAKLAPEWASLPTLAGNSYYGQPVRRAQSLLDFYSHRVRAAGGKPVPLAAGTTTAGTTTGGIATGGIATGGTATGGTTTGGTAPGVTPAMLAALGGTATGNNAAMSQLIAALGKSSDSTASTAALFADIGNTAADNPLVRTTAAAQAQLGQDINNIGIKPAAHTPRAFSRLRDSSNPMDPVARQRRAGQALQGLASLFLD